MTQNKPYYSFIIPVYNEAGNVKDLHQEVLKTANALQKPFEIIFIDDASTDKTLEILTTLKPVTIIQLRKNSGQSSALDAGIKQAKGEILITLDGDGQNDPADIPALLEKLNDGFDVICGWRQKRRDPISKRFLSHGAKFLRRFLVNDGIHDSGCTLRVYKRDCFEGLSLYGEMHRMIPALLRWRGFDITELPVNHRPRLHGRSKYNWKRAVKGFLDMIDVWFWRKYEGRPLHLFGSLGLLLTTASLIMAGYLAFLKFFYSYSLSESNWPMVAVTGFLAGMQLVIFGLLANMIIHNQSSREFYQVKSITQK